MNEPVVDYVVNFGIRAFLLRDIETEEVFHKFSDEYLEILIRVCASRWMLKRGCPMADYLIKKHSCTPGEWQIKKREVSRIKEPRPGMVRATRDWVNRYEIHFCEALHYQLNTVSRSSVDS